MVDYDEQHSERSTPSTSVPSTSTYVTSRTPSATPVAEQVGRPNREPAPKRKKVAVEDNLLMLACEKLRVPAPTYETPTKDEHDSFGQTVAHDLRSMSREQVIHAKKLISDVLYEGQLQNLSISSRVISGNEGYNIRVPYSRVMSDPPYTASASNTVSKPNHDVYASYSQYYN